MIIKQILAISTLVGVMSFTGNFKADTTNAKIGFTVKGLFGTVHGSFTGLQSTIKFNEKDLEASSITASVETKTVSTGISLRNSDLRNKAEWFDAAKYPKITIQSKKITKASSGYKMLGDLTIRGITKAIDIPFTFDSKVDGGLFKSEFTILRSDYRLGKEGGSVGSVITVILSVPVSNMK